MEEALRAIYMGMGVILFMGAITCFYKMDKILEETNHSVIYSQRYSDTYKK